MTESTVICVDNSEWTRNGDYAPNRFQAQADAVNLLAGAKTQNNPENTVGVLTMAGKSPTVLCTPTPDLGRILNSMQELDIEGRSSLSAALQIAQLALKHRQNKNQRQRIVIFVGSPIAEDKDALVKIAKKLKKNNVAVDVVGFGDEDGNEDKLTAFHEAVNSGDNSHLVNIPVGSPLSDSLYGTPIFQGEGSGFGGIPGAGGEDGAPAGFEFGVDPSLDPELALALRVSLEEERARQTAATAAAGAPPDNGAGPSGSAEVSAAAESGAAAMLAPVPEADKAEPMDEDDLLQQALAMSMAAEEPMRTPTPIPQPVADSASQSRGPTELGGEAMDEDVDKELQEALRMSMAEDAAAGAAGASDPHLDVSEALRDSEYMDALLGSLPGVDSSDPALRNLGTREEKKDDMSDGKEHK